MSEQMRITGIICEYNPFHSGHAYHIASTRKAIGADAVVAIMSGEFSQRGSATICDKWTRARMALAGGADIVIELPFLYATQSAQGFAAGGVRILDAIGADCISFGAETPDLEMLYEAAAVLDAEPPKFKSSLRTSLDNGESYAVSQRKALAAQDPALVPAVATPNNLLAIQYLRAMRQMESRMMPIAIARRGAGHASMTLDENTYPSSTAIRLALEQSSPSSADLIDKGAILTEFTPVFADSKLFLLASARLRNADPKKLAHVHDMEDGLAWRMTKAARNATSWSDLVDGIASRRHPPARVRRLLLYLLLDVHKSDMAAANAPDAPVHAHVLGVRQKSLPVLSELARRSTIPIGARVSQFPATGLTEFDDRSCDLYGLLMDPVRPAGANRSTRLMLV